MKLTAHSDIALRILIYLGTHPGRPVPVAEVSRVYELSQHHVAKVAHLLLRSGVLETRRGKAGGYLLARAPEDINVGAVMRMTEPDFELLPCFQKETDTCRISPVCRLKGVLQEARDAFLAVLDRHTVADLLKPRAVLRELFAATAPSRSA
jgi:Rrf2 family transcriptional regulator, nitric oxide-sensitive transcriptional repressor